MGGFRVSVIVPAFNPQERILSRVLRGLATLDRNGLEVDVCLVDNCSAPPLAERPYVRAFLAECPGARVVREERQGLTYARLAGIRASSGRIVVVLDDDNVPERGYLRVAAQCAHEKPWVGVWGPGTIDVELLDPVPSWLEDRVRAIHNQRRDPQVAYGCVPVSWQPYYPIGMGQVIRREVADRYADAVEGGRLSATDRRGASLASGGDIQIVWQAISMGLAAGIHPELAVSHLIPANRTTLPYLKRLAFGCGMSYHPAMVQSFPAAAVAQVRASGWRDGVGLLGFLLRRAARGRIRFLGVDFANLLGLLCGRMLVEGRGSDHWTFRLARGLGLT